MLVGNEVKMYRLASVKVTQFVHHNVHMKWDTVGVLYIYVKNMM